MGAYKADAIVLRSIRYGEADRILHLYTADNGRISAIAKGSRRPNSRFGGRLEPFFRLRMDLHEGRSELHTVTGAHTLAGHARLRTDVRALDSATRACDAVARLFETSEPHPAVFNLLCRKLSLLDDEPARATRALTLAFRLKLLVAAGLVPRLSACGACSRAIDELQRPLRFSGPSGGVLCDTCWPRLGAAHAAGGESFPIDDEALGFMLAALSRPLADAPEAPTVALRQVERSVADTLEHHAHVRLMPAAAPYVHAAAPAAPR
jgi:DNA repair protein RecO (recombination protein O)